MRPLFFRKLSKKKPSLSEMASNKSSKIYNRLSALGITTALANQAAFLVYKAF